MDITNHEKFTLINCDNLHDFHLLIDFLNVNIVDPSHLIINFLNAKIDQNLIISDLNPFYLNWQKRN